MKRLLVCLLLVGVVGCGESDQVEKSEQAEKQQSGQSEEQDPRFRVNLPPGVRGNHSTQQPQGETPKRPAQETAAQTTKQLVYKPLYRILTKQGLHIFTCSEEEVDTHAQLGNKIESVLGYVVQHEANNTIPLVKYLHPSLRKYWHYTTTERPAAIPASVDAAQIGWIFSTPADDRIRIYHLRNLETQEELFTENTSEFRQLLKSGWHDMRTEIYVVQRSAARVSTIELHVRTAIKKWEAISSVANTQPKPTLPTSPSPAPSKVPAVQLGSLGAEGWRNVYTRPMGMPINQIKQQYPKENLNLTFRYSFNDEKEKFIRPQLLAFANAHTAAFEDATELKMELLGGRHLLTARINSKEILAFGGINPITRKPDENYIGHKATIELTAPQLTLIGLADEFIEIGKYRFKFTRQQKLAISELARHLNQKLNEWKSRR